MIKLLHGDCLELMKDIPDKSIDMILCDLPYGTTACKWDVVIPFEPLWKEYKRIIKDRGCIALFGSEPFSSHLRMSNIKNYKYDLYWVKEKPVNFFQLKRRFGKLTENICIFYDKQPTYNAQKEKHLGKKVTNRPSKNAKFKNEITGLSNSTMKPYNDDGTRFPCDILKFNRVSVGKSLHITEKPVDLLSYLINTFTNRNETVLDNCMGSGSTGVACMNTNRNFIGIEKDDKYFEIAKNRIEKVQQDIVPKV
jgi:DNA modification methylase